MSAVTLLITRPTDAAQRFVSDLSPEVLAGVEVVISPLLEIVPTGVAPDLSGVSAVIFTSQNGVADAPDGQGRPAYCVGPRTAQAARETGWDVKHHSNNADALLSYLLDVRPAGPLVHLAGTHRRGDIAGKLTKAGIRTDLHVLYDQRPVALSERARSALAGGVPVIVPLLSPRTASCFLAQADSLAQVSIVAISAAVARLFEGCNLRALHIAAEPNANEMRYAVENLLRCNSLT